MQKDAYDWMKRRENALGKGGVRGEKGKAERVLRLGTVVNWDSELSIGACGALLGHAGRSEGVDQYEEEGEGEVGSVGGIKRIGSFAL